eukprot:TRINITY_DN513_c0_g1_i1.p1 TRINITY_DN513_c0_g1~~TRINITY_DN513_c0_g1_i1.p1  ORF type:complete len:163 (-),score=15.85 TRINITY_DN513_c0_g1_i1:33-485(-)
MIHAKDGARVGCGLIRIPGPRSAEIYSYPGTNSSVRGSVVVKQTGSGINLDYSFTGLEASVTQGWHIHTGKTCTNKTQVGGNYWLPSMMIDPWLTIKYTSDESGKATGQIQMVDFTMFDVKDRAIVVHAETGLELVCLIRTPRPRSADYI